VLFIVCEILLNVSSSAGVRIIVGEASHSDFEVDEYKEFIVQSSVLIYFIIMRFIFDENRKSPSLSETLEERSEFHNLRFPSRSERFFGQHSTSSRKIDFSPREPSGSKSSSLCCAVHF
jgi:hypothetical protein